MKDHPAPSRARPRWLLVAALLSALAGLTWTTASAEPPKAPPDPDPDHAAKMARGLDLFKKQVRPLLLDRCVKCHGGKATEHELDLTDRDKLLKGGTSGPAVVPGKSKDSLLYRLITAAKEPAMPFRGPRLSAEEVAAVAAWIDNGAPYDGPLTAETTAKASWTERVIADDARKFWAFQPLHRVTPPAVKDEAWVRTPADRFVLEKLEAAGVNPNPAVSRQRLIRRAYLDLVGLPPTPEEVRAFEEDPAPDAYEKLVDRLLDSPHFGERWARHWLDLARFAESHGFEHDYDRPTAYHYRDFVIQALNEDLPFDTFVKWQLAGDELAPDNPLALKGTGFLAAGVHSTQITQNEVERHRYDELDDMLATTGTAFLGLTVGCARCHDHKFDPIPQRDYYRMLSAFTTTVRSEIDLHLDPAGDRNAREAFDREHAPFALALREFEAEQLPARLAEWEKTPDARPERFAWVVLDVAEAVSAEGATFTRLEDGSLLAGGKNGKFDTYTFTAPTDLTGITAIRLEALADPSLAKGGPGRAGNGNFALTDLKVKAAPKAGGQAVAVKLRNPRATFEQPGLPVAAVIDADERSGWAVDPQFGKDHAAAFETETPAGFEGGTVLTFTLQFKNNDGHQIGRPRLSLSTAKQPAELQGDGIPPGALASLRTPAEKRNAEQAAALAKWYRTLDPEWRKLNQAAQEHLRKAPQPATVKAMISTEGLPAVRLHTQGDDFLPQTHFLKRGDPERKEGVATLGYLQVLTTAADPQKRWQPRPPPGARTSFRRAALAEWLTDPDGGAGQLLARVIVNRLWQLHLGRGIVATPSDFGSRGEPPTHPELLDWLAGELIRNHWQLKPIHKLIMTSAVYREGSERDEPKVKADPDNKLLWRRPPRRLEAEAIRDAMLAVGGVLDARMYGPGTLDEASRRRSIYFTVKRSKLVPMMQAFDAPDALGGLGERPTTTVAPQALLLMNNPQVRAWAKGLARRIAPDAKMTVEDAVRQGYEVALTRPPTAEELADSVAFVKAQAEAHRAAGQGDGRELALADFCQVLLCLNEFVYVD
jgi:mono/diheme cytochrome c family protein